MTLSSDTLGCVRQPSTSFAFQRQQKVVLVVCHPCTGCKHDVAVCIPACCQGTPKGCFERTLIGQGKTVFEWSCGHQVVVRYHHDGGYRVIQRS